MRPMTWKQLVRPDRMHRSRRGEQDERTEFERDYDRIIYASPFRRLQDKAQVFPLEHNDFVRTRLTHSLEVSTLGRSLGRHVGRHLAERHPEISADDLGTIVATTCLAHDIGNPPFGHFGEETIRAWFDDHRDDVLAPLDPRERADFLHFDGNAQGLRILMFLQSLGGTAGLNLTFTTLATFMKYVVPAHRVDASHTFRKKPGFFLSEADAVTRIRDALELGPRRHPLAFLMEAADDMAYSVVDIEDGLKKRVLRPEYLVETLRERLRGTRFVRLVDRLADGCSAPGAQRIDDKVDTAIQWFRIGAIGGMFQAVVGAFLEHEEAILAGTLTQPLMKLAGEARVLWEALVEIARENVYCAPEILELELYGDRVIRDLLDRFVPACLSLDRDNPTKIAGKHYALISPNLRHIHETLTPRRPYDRIQLAVDFICGMTDTYAVAVHERLNSRRAEFP